MTLMLILTQGNTSMNLWYHALMNYRDIQAHVIRLTTQNLGPRHSGHLSSAPILQILDIG